MARKHRIQVVLEVLGPIPVDWGRFRDFDFSTFRTGLSQHFFSKFEPGKPEYGTRKSKIGIWKIRFWSGVFRCFIDVFENLNFNSWILRFPKSARKRHFWIAELASFKMRYFSAFFAGRIAISRPFRFRFRTENQPIRTQLRMSIFPGRAFFLHAPVSARSQHHTQACLAGCLG